MSSHLSGEEFQIIQHFSEQASQKAEIYRR